MPLLDQAVSALVTDLHERGLDKDVSVVVWGEFGRTPQHQQGRRPRPLAAGQLRLLAGGGMRTGQVIGETNRLAEYAVKTAGDVQEVFATLYTQPRHQPEPGARRSTRPAGRSSWSMPAPSR